MLMRPRNSTQNNVFLLYYVLSNGRELSFWFWLPGPMRINRRSWRTLAKAAGIYGDLLWARHWAYLHALSHLTLKEV